MVEEIRGQGMDGDRLLRAVLEVPRHLFVDEALRGRAYRDASLPIGSGQTISRPSVVARMLARLDPRPGEKVLEVGTGSGYQTALLAHLTGGAFTIERLPSLAARARDSWARCGARGIELRVGDGTRGWSARAPFDAIVVSAAAPVVPAPLLAQLAPGGRMILPVGHAFQQTLRYLTRTENGARVEEGEAVSFVRLIGSEGFAE